MTFQVEMLAILIAAGIILLVAEIYLPGAIAGTLGGISLFAAVVYAFAKFGSIPGVLITAGIAVLTGIIFVFWFKYFPKTAAGRKLMLNQDLSNAKAGGSEFQPLIGKEGETLSELRPAGFAAIEKRRMDVVTQGEMVLKGERVRVIAVEGNRVVVAAVKKQQ